MTHVRPRLVLTLDLFLGKRDTEIGTVVTDAKLFGSPDALKVLDVFWVRLEVPNELKQGEHNQDFSVRRPRDISRGDTRSNAPAHERSNTTNTIHLYHVSGDS